MSRFSLLTLLLSLAGWWGPPGDARAHGTGHGILQDPRTVAVVFHYADRTLMRFAEVLVFSPADLDVEHQNGRTDRNGVFAFRPDLPGTWVIEADDGMGHRERAEIRLEEPAPGEEVAILVTKQQASRTVGIVTGLSLLLNLSLAGYIIVQRSKPPGGRC